MSNSKKLSELEAMEQRELLYYAKKLLGMKWNELAQYTKIKPRAMEVYRLPEGSKGRRGMPTLAKDAVIRAVIDYSKGSL